MVLLLVPGGPGQQARGGHEPDPGLRAAVTRTLQALDDLSAGEREEWAESWRAAYVVAAHACAAALDGRPSVDLWRHAVDILDRTGFALWRLRLQPYLAEDLWTSGDRAAARVVVHDTWHEATRRSLGGVARHAEAVARSRRIGLPTQPLPGVQARLTPREREVLALLDRGATNRQIAAELFISEKTVSVHVSNVLAKLGASHRGEAVALARRADNG